ncbi:hypothetical protein TRVL_02727 [Trypanosoma vivax]|nr:hypothetical protein TRVL_02727 [Trypanosoma vivax]
MRALSVYLTKWLKNSGGHTVTLLFPYGVCGRGFLVCMFVSRDSGDTRTLDKMLHSLLRPATRSEAVRAPRCPFERWKKVLENSQCARHVGHRSPTINDAPDPSPVTNCLVSIRLICH